MVLYISIFLLILSGKGIMKYLKHHYSKIALKQWINLLAQTALDHWQINATYLWVLIATAEMLVQCHHVIEKEFLNDSTLKKTTTN